jgi:hypothetical protein
VIMIGNIWLARVEVENALESAALAAVMEWGENPGYAGDTLIPRDVGVAYAATNTMTGLPVAIATNYDHANLTGSVNQNLLCSPTKPDPDGNLVFGAVTIENPDTPDEYVTFDAGTRPGCGIGSVTFDVSGQGKTLGDDNWWGVSFRSGIDGLRIKSITYDLRAGSSTTGVFITAPTLSDNEHPQMVVDKNSEQPDIAGFTDLNAPNDPNEPGQIKFVIEPQTPWLLTINFSAASDGSDDGFAPCERMRFGVSTNGVDPPGNSQNDGDAMGRAGVGVSVIFEIGNSEFEPVYTTFYDNLEKKKCLDDVTEPECGSMIVHPGNFPDVPCPPSSASTNNGQSLAFLSGNGGKLFGVRAQAIVPVPNPFCAFTGLSVQPHFVTVKTTAVYDCTQDRAWLIRIDRFICPGPE